MLPFWKKNKINNSYKDAIAYVQDTFENPSQTTGQETIRTGRLQGDAGVKYSIGNAKDFEIDYDTGSIRFSSVLKSKDKYDEGKVSEIMNSLSSAKSEDVAKSLDSSLDQSFTEKLRSMISEKGLREPDVYKAAHMDRRLFSKISANNKFKPAKDTALALIFALKLSFPQASDLLMRAGYTLSHSNKRDVILEYFLMKRIYNLTDINLVLEQLGEKKVGR